MYYCTFLELSMDLNDRFGSPLYVTEVLIHGKLFTVEWSLAIFTSDIVDLDTTTSPTTPLESLKLVQSGGKSNKLKKKRRLTGFFSVKLRSNKIIYHIMAISLWFDVCVRDLINYGKSIKKSPVTAPKC